MIPTQQIIFLSLIVTGFLWGKKIPKSDKLSVKLNKLLFNILIPIVLFVSIYKNFSAGAFFNFSFILIYLSAFVINSIFTYFLFGKTEIKNFLLTCLGGSYINLALFALPMIVILLQDIKAAVLLNLIQLFFINLPILLIINYLQNKGMESRLKIILKTILHPIFFFIIVGIILSNFSISLPGFSLGILSFISKVTIPLALFAFGLSLSKLKFSKTEIDKKTLILTLQKNLGHPLIIWAMVTFIPSNLSPYWINALLISGLSPTAILVHIYTKKFNILENTISKVILCTSIISLITLTFIFPLIKL